MTGYSQGYTMLINPANNRLSFRIAELHDVNDFNKVGGFNCYSIILILAGSGKLRVDFSEYNFIAQSLICISLYQPFQLTDDGPLEAWLINFHPDFFCIHKHQHEVACNGVLFNDIYESPLVSLTNDEAKLLSELVAQMRSEIRQVALAQYELLVSYLKIFLINASRFKLNHTLIKTSDTAREPYILKSLQEAVEVNFKKLHSPTDYSNLLSITPKALNRIVKTHFNKTLTNLIAERIIVEAKRELYLTAKSIKLLALELGFKDEFYFSRFFKKNAGTSPQNYRDTVGIGRG